jgi:O-antigen ligase
MINLILYLANASTVATVLLVPFLGVRRIVAIQLALMPLTHIYLVGLGLSASAAFQLISTSNQRPRRFEIPLLILYPWAIWLVAAALSLATNGVSGRSLFQAFEFVFYGLVGTLIFQLVRQGAADLKYILNSLMAAAVGLNLTLGYLYATQGVQIGYFMGSNEGAFILIVCGLIVPAYGLSTSSDWKKTVVCWTIMLVSFATIYMSESRAGIGFGLAIVGSFAISRIVGTSLAKSALVAVVLLIIASQNSWVQRQFGEVFDTSRNFSNIERVALIETCFQLFSEQPFTGWGWGTIEELLEKHSRSSITYPHPHNTYAHFAAEIGIGGLICLFAIFWGLWKIARTNYRQGRHQEAIFALYCLATLVVLGMVNDYFFGANRGIIVAVMLGLAASVYVPPTPRTRNSRRGLRPHGA